jgi:cardiolipin synthase
VYAGSANLDTRSLHINYELMVRLTHRPTLSEARAIFAQDLKQSLRVDPLTWRQSRSFWDKLAERWAYFLLARVDPYIARRLLRTMG